MPYTVTSTPSIVTLSSACVTPQKALAIAIAVSCLFMFFVPRNVRSIFVASAAASCREISGSEQLGEFDSGETKVSLKYAGSRTRRLSRRDRCEPRPELSAAKNGPPPSVMTRSVKRGRHVHGELQFCRSRRLSHGLANTANRGHCCSIRDWLVLIAHLIVTTIRTVTPGGAPTLHALDAVAISLSAGPA
jgi:hypothetical protein